MGRPRFLAVPFGALDDVLRTAGDGLKGKVLVDVTNALIHGTVVHFVVQDF